MTDDYYNKLTSEDKEFESIIKAIVPKFEKYNGQKNIEIEFRTTCTELSFLKILELFKDNTNFTSEYSVLTDEYDQNGYRRTNGKVIKKTKLDQYIFLINDTEIRMVISKEVPAQKFGMVLHKRLKKRHRFIYKDWIYDLTEATYDDTKVSYEIEIELNNTVYALVKKYKSIEYIVHSTLLKFRDLLI